MGKRLFPHVVTTFWSAIHPVHPVNPVSNSCGGGFQSHGSGVLKEQD
jgi:hypothetical protein